MPFLWRQRAYCAPTPSSFCWQPGDGNESEGARCRTPLLSGPIPAPSSSSSTGDVPLLHDSSGVRPPLLRSNSEIFSVYSDLPQGLLGHMTSVTMPGSDIFFLPKPSNLLKVALPVFVFMPNITIFTKAWPFFAHRSA